MDHINHLQSLTEITWLFMSDMLHDLSYLFIFFLLFSIFLSCSQTFGFISIMQMPCLDTFQNKFDRFVEIQPAHTDNAITVRTSCSFCNTFFTHFDQTVITILQRIEIIDYFTALRQCIAGIKHTNQAAHNSFFNRIFRNHLFITMTDIIHRFANPLTSQFS